MAQPLSPGGPQPSSSPPNSPLDHNHPGDYLGDDPVAFAKNLIAQWHWVATHLSEGPGREVPSTLESIGKYRREAGLLQELVGQIATKGA